ncbi:MAG: two component, sigma54 specific, transcriptional regulator, Fis family [Myxococcales bacterium]|nr:two component, sigma54 specific, transcriptional regulator, Fis family [Myxococcales bacterium]
MANRPALARILAVDDSADLRELYELALELAGYSVVLASDGQQALELARALRPDVIITDVSMPGMDGLELLTRLRSDLAPPLPPIVVCSGFDMAESTAMRLGAFRFLRKPLETAELLAVVALALQKRVVVADSVTREKGRIRQARERAAAAAVEALEGVDFSAPEVAFGLQGLAEWIAGYFGLGAAALTFVEGSGDLRVRAASHGSTIAAGSVFDGRALYSSGVLASGASLVVTDAAAHPFASDRARQLGIRFFVGVPLSFDDTPVGSIWLFDAAPRSFAAEDLLIVEELGRGTLRSSTALPQSVERIGMFTPATFRRLLAAELAIHRRAGGSFDVAIVEYASGHDVDDVLGALYCAESAPRLGVGYGSSDSLALFKRDPTATGASRAMSAALGAVAATAPLRAAGWISLGPDPPSPSAQDLMELAHGAFAQACAGAPGTVERFELRREPWHDLGDASPERP